MTVKLLYAVSWDATEKEPEDRLLSDTPADRKDFDMRRTSIAVTVTAAMLVTTLGACAGTGTGTVDGTVPDRTTTVTDGSVTSQEDATPTSSKHDDKDATAEKEDERNIDTKAGSDKMGDVEKGDAVGADNEAIVKAAKAEGKTVLTGTVVIVDGPDIFEYEGMDPKVMGGAQSEEGNTYAILELDEDTLISGMGADGFPREEAHDLIGLGHDLPKYDEIKDTASQWKQYEGQRVCVAGDAVFPTDVSFPTEGTLHDAELLYVEAVG